MIDSPTVPSGVKIIQVSWMTHQPVLKSLRTEVFVEEQGVSAQDEWDDHDADAQHLLAMDETSEPIGTARLLPSGKLTRMAVVRAWRNRGVGSQLVATAIEVAKNSGIEHLYLDAQINARSFYERNGFIAEGEPFVDAGIVHIRMHRNLVEPPPPSGVIHFTQRFEVQESLKTFTQRARHSIDVLSDSLSLQIYGEREFVALISKLARRGARSRVRILVRDSRALRGADHALVNLARRLPSRVSLRRVIENTPMPSFSFYCVDSSHLVYFSSESEFKGFASYSARAESRRHLGEFENWWQYASEPDPDLGSIRI